MRHWGGGFVCKRRRNIEFALILPAVLGILVAASGKAATFEELAAQAATARRGNNTTEAVELYRQAVRLRANWAEGWWFLGTLSYASYHYAECDAAFDEFVKLDPQRALAWSLLGLCEFETGKYDAAVEHFPRGLAGELDPQVEAAVRFHYGLLLTRSGRFDQAKEELDRYALAGGKEPLLIVGLGLNGMHEAWLPNEIPATLQDAVLKAGNAVRSWILDDTEQAESGLRKLVKEYPRLAGVHYLYGSYVSTRHPEEAMAEFRLELRLNPGNADAAAMLALLLLNARDASGALPYAKMAAAAGPLDALAEYSYGAALAATGEVLPAIKLLESAEQMDPGKLEYHMALAGAYSRAGRYEDARRERRISVQMSVASLAPHAGGQGVVGEAKARTTPN